jgi:hypothetical protein
VSTIEADRVREHQDERIHAGSVEDVIGLAVDPGELVLFQSKVLRRLTFQLFEKAVVVLTDRRLLIVSPMFPNDHEVTQVHLNTDCGVLNSKERFDGSRIVAIRHESGHLCLYFARPWRAQAEWICQTLGPAVDEPAEVDRFQLSQEFGGLVEVLEEQENELDDI